MSGYPHPAGENRYGVSWPGYADPGPPLGPTGRDRWGGPLAAKAGASEQEAAEAIGWRF